MKLTGAPMGEIQRVAKSVVERIGSGTKADLQRLEEEDKEKEAAQVG